MAWNAPSDPVGGTVITVAWAVSNVTDNLRWLRLMTGNADPPGSGYVVTADSTTATTWKTLLAAVTTGISQGLVNTSMSLGGNFSTAGTISTTSNSVNSIVTQGGISAAGNIAAAGGVSAASGTIAGLLSAGSYDGGSTSAGTPEFLGVTVGASGYAGGSAAAGSPSFLGITVGTGGVDSTGAIATDGNLSGASLTIGSTTNAHAPSGLVASFRTAAEIATGWSRETSLNGRMMVGAGTTFSTTFDEGQDYGSSWSHTHQATGLSASYNGGSVTGTPSNTSTRQDGANAVAGENHTHTLPDINLTGAVQNTAWAIPSRAYVFARKT